MTTRPIQSIDQYYWRHPNFPQVEIRSTFNSTQQFKQHSHPHLSLGAIIDGCTQVYFGGEAVVCKQGDLVLIEPQGAHSCNPIANKTRSYHMLYLEVDWCLQKLSALYAHEVTQLSCDSKVINNPSLYQIFLKLVESTRHSDTSAIGTLLDTVVTELLGRYCSPNQIGGESGSVPLQIKNALTASIESPPSLSELANQFELRPETILRNFKNAYGLTPKQFVVNARVEKAKVMLRQGQSIADVAIKLGFSDQAQFHKAFVDYTASTPGQYLKAMG